MAPNLTCAWIVLLQLWSLAVADVSHLDYSITPSSQLAYYHYPAPNRPGVQRAAQRSQYQQYPHVARQFAEPSLEQAAFTQALTSQGYVFGAPSAPLQVAPSQQVASSSTGRSIASASVDANSLNLKLPVPFGIAPLNVAQLPLQAGAPYASVPRTTGLTSYGTPQIQRR
ncbi:uncharacterized protein LOC128257037 [Drosophila gunungcola]|uniref:Uncharacterized protein n=1 Tax=Drosophila gunungcola TaxID=103775 RepID=A0A9P9YRN6_9MUSC|nr:uncharacterized protein LOC128257037 [Drosophila gunungcola]KAI8041653.1 hypothetical protein M5D96_005918 [Drosophila gunungcola]